MKYNMSGDVEEKRCPIKLTEETQEEQVTFDKCETADNVVKQTTCISKRQLKKQARHEKWLQQKPIRRAKEKKKEKEKTRSKRKGNYFRTKQKVFETSQNEGFLLQYLYCCRCVSR
ncbi:uncharacterized protein LOC143235858 [Tachypleus tridentatus]|uniref:uncharacterized protein LOC143235858 n=1 Tax=Tachypleus tridentatus TaxID=6853 RepID=UPI003FD0FA72